MIASGYDYAGAGKAAQGGIMPAPKKDDDMLRYLMQMGALSAEEQQNQMALARAQALRKTGAGLMEGRQIGDIYQAPTNFAGIVNAVGQGLGGWNEASAGRGLSRMPGKYQGVPLPSF